MQYILQQSELDDLVPKCELAVTRLANHVLREMLVGEACVNSVARLDAGQVRYMHCDECLIGKFVSTNNDRAVSHAMCDRDKNWST